MSKTILVAALAALSLSACISRETVVRPPERDTVVVPSTSSTPGDTTVVVPRR